MTLDHSRATRKASGTVEVSKDDVQMTDISKRGCSTLNLLNSVLICHRCDHSASYDCIIFRAIKFFHRCFDGNSELLMYKVI